MNPKVRRQQRARERLLSSTRYRVTAHAAARANELGFPLEEVIRCVVKPDQSYPGGPTHRHGRRIHQRDQIAVVLDDETFAVVTARRAPFVVNARPANDLVRHLDPPTNQPRSAWGRWLETTDTPEESVLSPRDVLLRRAVPLPETLRPLLERPSAQAAAASKTALRATLGADHPNTDTMRPPASRTKTSPPATRLARSQHAERQRPDTAPVPGLGAVGAAGR